MPNPKTIRGFFVDPENNTAEERTIEKSLESYYSLLCCDTIDIVSRSIGGKRYDIICDDEALLKAPTYTSALDSDGHPALFNALFVVKFDGRDDVTDLDDEDINNVGNHLTGVVVSIGDDFAYYNLLEGVDY